ncbi:MAG: YIP1 family protein [Ignavibacteriae bacterium]|nr:YIP1 family protein [Ignavibacteriota bacterium]
MIACKVCGKLNEETSVLCASCRSYLQPRIDAINLFETVWALVESPRQTFRKIVLSQHKNYVFFLSSLLGINLVHTIFWYRNLGNQFSSLFTLTGAGFIVGPLLGILYTLVLSFLLQVMTRARGGSATLRNMFAVVAYAGVPIVMSFVFVWPIEIAVFGIYFFGNNPSPMTINWLLYLILISIDGVAVVWSVVLLVIGTLAANGFTRERIIFVTLSVMLLVAASWFVLHVA